MELSLLGAKVPGSESSCYPVSAVSCLVVPAFICIDLLISLVLKINDDDDDVK